MFMLRLEQMRPKQVTNKEIVTTTASRKEGRSCGTENEEILEARVQLSGNMLRKPSKQRGEQAHWP